MKSFIIPFSEVSMSDIALVGGKNASLGEMIQALGKDGIHIPAGFALTVDAYREFVSENAIGKLLLDYLSDVDTSTLDNLAEIGRKCRWLVLESEIPDKVRADITSEWEHLVMRYGPGLSLAVRSSATAEDSPTMSFAGQHDSFLNVKTLDGLLYSIKKCYASLFNDRAIKYRLDHNLSLNQIGLSVGVQLMVRSDKGSAGVAFTIDPETGNNNLIYITGAWGLGESVVQGAVNTDEFYYFKEGIRNGMQSLVWKRMASKDKMVVYGSGNNPVETIETPMQLRDQYVLTRSELDKLARWCLIIEDHYKTPMDIEWAKDDTGTLYIVQARPETIHNKSRQLSLKEYSLNTVAQPVLKGKAVGRSIVSGKVTIVSSLADSEKVKQGDILVADITNPDWNALLRKAVCIITNKGGRTSHASIVARELGIPAVVGTGSATQQLKDGQVVTVSCANGDEGLVYDGKLTWVESETDVSSLDHTSTAAMFILADPEKASQLSMYPNNGVGLFRMEFAISNHIEVHPMALAQFDRLPNGPEKNQILALTRHYSDKRSFFIEKLSESIALVAASFYPKEVIVRMSDFKTNEYAKLIGGKFFEPEEENPMLGFRGASRYYNPRYKDGFELECAAIKHVRERMGLKNVKVMIPFCRTVGEAERVLETMKGFGLERGKQDLEVYVMAEVPSNILLADDFAELFDGFSIGSNDLTQLTLGIDRDSAIVADLFKENNEAVQSLIRHLIVTAHNKGVKVGLCGQAPSDDPEFAKFLVACSIDSISFNPDAMIRGIQNIVAAERERVVTV